MFKKILVRAKSEVKRYWQGWNVNYIKLVVKNKRELGQIKRAFSKYQRECQALMDEDNFDMSEYESYKKVCEYISEVIERALVLD